MSAYESMVSDHWVANLTNLPVAARGYFACFALVRNAWDSCVNGSWLLRLALELAPDEQGREEVRRVAAEVVRGITDQLTPHFVDRPKDDPIRFAYEDARTELQLSVGPVDKPMLETAVSEAELPIYERSIRILRRFASDLVRARLSHPIGLRPDPAFEDTKAIPPHLLPELARMKAEAEALTQQPPVTQPQPPPTLPQPSTIPQAQLSVPGVPRPTPTLKART